MEEGDAECSKEGDGCKHQQLLLSGVRICNCRWLLQGSETAFDCCKHLQPLLTVARICNCCWLLQESATAVDCCKNLQLLLTVASICNCYRLLQEFATAVDCCKTLQLLLTGARIYNCCCWMLQNLIGLLAISIWRWCTVQCTFITILTPGIGLLMDQI
jgi:hypothetical protein